MGRLSIDRSFASKGDQLEYTQRVDLSEAQQRPGHSFSRGDELLEGTIASGCPVDQLDAGTVRIDYPIVARQVPDSDLPFIVADEVAKYSGFNGRKLWIVVDNIVLDCSDFKKQHPGGKGIIEGFGGQDCSWQWWTFHSQQIMRKHGLSLRVGRTSGVENRHTKPERQAAPLRNAGEQW